jgi:4-amino-4-deoxy-L-arabinose transferase-like glycosyltransferase
MARFTRSHRILLCAGVSTLLYLTALGRPPLWEPDEGRYAEIAREMVMRGDYVTPRNDWVRYFEKPPLVYWTTAAALKLFGRNEFAVRLQAALFSVGQVIVTEALGETMFGVTAGLLGALALGLSPLFFAFARFATPDPALAFFLTAGLASFYCAASTPDFRRGTGRNWMLLAAAMLALGTLAKGPVALLLGGGIALAWMIMERRGRDAMRIPWLECIAVYSAITLPWFIVVAERNPGFLRFFFFHEHLRRYLEATEHGWGPWFFIPVTAAGMWPWMYFVPLGVYETLVDDTRVATIKTRNARLFLLVWFGAVLVFFSIPRSKLGQYILPGIPPLAVIAGCGLARLVSIIPERKRRILGWFVVVNAIIVVAVAAAAIYLMHREIDTALAIAAIAAVDAVLAGATLAYVLSRTHRYTPATVMPVALGVIVAMGIAAKARNDSASMFSYRVLARTTAAYLGDGCLLASYRHHVQALPFYTGERERLVDYRGELAPFGDSPDAASSFIATDARLQALWTSRSCMVLIANRRDLPKLQHLLNPAPSIIGCEGKKLALYNSKVVWLQDPPDECRDLAGAVRSR